MRLLQLRYFIPHRRNGFKMLPNYLKWRLDTLGRRPTLRELWSFLEWCRVMNCRATGKKW